MGGQAGACAGAARAAPRRRGRCPGEEGAVRLPAGCGRQLRCCPLRAHWPARSRPGPRDARMVGLQEGTAPPPLASSKAPPFLLRPQLGTVPPLGSRYLAPSFFGLHRCAASASGILPPKTYRLSLLTNKMKC